MRQQSSSAIKLGSLFDGIGGFPHSASKFGITPIWASEIEPWPIKVTKKHFPNMTHLGDITKINGAEIEPVDIITFGSPCTRLSVAGKHDGFDITFKCYGEDKDSEGPHYTNTIKATDKYQYEYKEICPVCGKELIETNESALFFHAIRVIREMRDATNGTHPRFAVWENVPGAFSSNKGEDFRAVLSEITESEIPMPASGKWANAGMVRTEHADLAWRVLDAQYWGVPQRRRRIFLVADFGGQCAGEILFKSEGVRGDTAESGETREEVAGAVGNGVKTSGFGETGIGYWQHGIQCLRAEGRNRPSRPSNVIIAQCLTSKTGCRYNPEAETLIPVTLSGDKVRTLTARADSSPCVDRGQEVIFVPIHPVVAGTLCASGAGTNRPAGQGNETDLVIAFAQNQRDEVRDLGNKTGSIQAEPGMKQQTFIIQNATVDCRNFYENPDLSGTLQAKNNSLNHQNQVRIGNYVRRLTPLECLRLQGYPDWWLDIDGMSDTQKYKAVGNSVAIPCVDYVMSGIAEVMRCAV